MTQTLSDVVHAPVKHRVLGKSCMHSLALLFAVGIFIHAGDAFSQDPLAGKDTGEYTMTSKAGQQTTLRISKVRDGIVREFYLNEIHYWWDAGDNRYYRRGSLHCLYFEQLSPGVYKYEVYDTWWNRTVESGSAL